jgi:amino acid transporter
MQKIVLTFGLIAGAVLSVMMLLTLPFLDKIGFDKGEVIGYTTMVLAFLMVFFGVKSYRDNVAGGRVTFWRAFLVGLMITAVASVCYVATWQVIYYKVAPDFGEKYTAYAVEKARKSGASEVQIATTKREMTEFMDMYKNPFVNIAITFLEPLPVGLLFTLVSAGVLSRKRHDKDDVAA